jgi:hypothetical protein
MPSSSEIKRNYDSDIIVEQLSAPMKKWAKMGFMRGFVGLRTEALPKGKMVLPSAAFNEVALKAIDEGKPTYEEMTLRTRFVAEVDQKLREMQGEAINRHFKFATIGQFVDIVMAIGITILIVGLLIRVGPYHPITMALVPLFGVKLLFVRHSAKRVLNIAQQAFKSKADQIGLPWSS